jgi:hypothetical protein
VSTKIGPGVGVGNGEHDFETRKEEEGRGRRRWLACRELHPALNAQGDVHLQPVGAMGTGKDRGERENRGRWTGGHWEGSTEVLQDGSPVLETSHQAPFRRRVSLLLI